MRFEVPDCRRCCLCVPLRHGILIFGYLNLVFYILMICLEAYLDWGDSPTSHTMTLYRGVGIYTQVWLPYILLTLEVVFNIILLVGVHMKRTSIIRVYYYYGIMTAVAACLTFIVVKIESRHSDFYFDFLEIGMAFSGFVLQAYLLLLIRSELQKLKHQPGRLSYVNHMSEVNLDPPPFGDGRNAL